ncbi:hypothetical protein FS749_003394 [Ceratobasidium sp. UAMH 11750]|nr:hypothetical protein FS749_003394 [Ceratobasidium sp. UAMH 11750]
MDPMDSPSDAMDSVQALTKAEIIQAAQPHIFRAADTRTLAKLLDHLKRAPPEVQQRIAQAGQEKQANLLARKRQSQTARSHQYRSKRQAEVTSPQEHNVDAFLDLPTADQRKECSREFLAATSDEALAQGVCASCARKLFQNELTWVDYRSLKNRHVFHPTTPHPAHILSDGMLSESQFLDKKNGGLEGWICRHCYWAHNKNRLPAYSLANDMFSRGYVYKLFPRGGRGTDHPDTLQTGLHGNVTTYHTNLEDVTRMLKGELMPRKTSILPSLIAVTFIGRGNFDVSKINPLFRVRRRVVSEALWELKHVTKHPGYINLDINQTALDLLPEDGLPEEIEAIVRREMDEGVVARESAGYVPNHETNDKLLAYIIRR